ncbi:MAG: universal stress protein [Nitrospirae bacterium]|nr:universal stress protein [Nitrospirota bacterium]
MMLKIKKILVPVDFTDYSNSVVDYAVMLARQFEAEITLIHAIEPFTYTTTDTLLVTDHYAALKEIARPLMAALHQKVSKKGVKVKSLLTRGTPHSEIVGKARKSRSNLIVIGTHGRKGLERFLLGSVAERVVRLAPCPVVTVRVDKSR